MPSLDAARRAKLPDSAFAYVDSRGQRRLPIHDRAHVRNALARFRQVAFEDDAARERARAKLLRAASRHGIMPIGFINGQLRTGASGRPGRLPSGLVTFLLTDMEASTVLLQRLGDDYGRLLEDVRAIHRAGIRDANGQEVDCRADEFFAVFSSATGAVAAAIAIQRALNGRSWAGGSTVRVRMGIHSGRPALTSTGYIGMAVNTAARVCGAAEGGQILLSDDARTAILKDGGPGIELHELGDFRLRGIQRPVTLHRVAAPDLPAASPSMPALASAVLPVRTDAPIADRNRA